MRRAIWLVPLALTLAAAGPPAPIPLKPDEGGVVGGWTSTGPYPVRGLYIARVEERSGCLRFVEGSPLVDLEDHLTRDKPAMWKVHRVKPGRYAISAVGWGNAFGGGYMTTSWFGSSRQHGALWIFDVDAGAVTDIGVWTVISPYAQRYVVGGQDARAGHGDADALAAGVGPLAPARVVRAEVVQPADPCPPAAASAP